MGLPEDQNGSAIRVSLGWASQAEDVEHFVEAWQALYRRLGNRSAA
jgi:cysteine sulfinate desulfinase/cysteine desulfurase-like protein